jgi:hypothetical protein
LSGVEVLFVDEVTKAGWDDPWADSQRTTSKLNEPLLRGLVQGPADELNDLTAALALLHLADNELRSYGTDGKEELTDTQMRLVLRALRATAARVGVPIEVPFRDFSGFRSYWNRNDGHGSWAARRSMVDKFFGEAFDKLEDLEARGRSPELPPASLANLSDPAAILDNLDRIRRAISIDPAQAVGSAKELIESTAKVVLIERGRTVDDKADLPALVKDAQQALVLHPSQATPGPDGTDAVKKILGGVSSIAIGVAELRNRGYGTGHGAASQRVGLRDRHAHLAVNAALTWCQLMLDTLADPKAPWKSSGAGSP